MVQQFVIYLNKYQMLPSFYLKGEKGEVQAQLVSMQHCKSPLAQVDMVVVGEVIATLSAMIKKITCYFINIYHWQSHCILNQKKRILCLFLTLSKNIIDKLFQALLPEKKKEDRKLQNVNLIKSRKNDIFHTRKSRTNNEKQLFTLISCN